MLGYARILNQSRGDLWENPLKVGELVKLRSGGPVMTVSGMRDDGVIAVVWHDVGGAEHNSGYPQELLRRTSGRSFFGLRRR